MSMSDANAVLDYWYGGGDKEKRPQWFGAGEKGAQEVKRKFGHLVSCSCLNSSRRFRTEIIAAAQEKSHSD